MGSLPKTKKKNFPKSINEMSPVMLQETLKKKKECDAKALTVVEKLCEPDVEKEWLLANLQFINQTHFDDVTVERAITKLCGYPLCNQKLEKISTQKYHISTRYNKVFDITERKNFCSSSCYKAAVFIKNQLFTSPLWFRDQEVIPVYKVLESDKSSLGKEVVFPADKIKSEYGEGIEGVFVKEKEFTDDSFKRERKIDVFITKKEDMIDTIRKKEGTDISKNKGDIGGTIRKELDIDNSIDKEENFEESVKILEVECSKLNDCKTSKEESEKEEMIKNKESYVVKKEREKNTETQLVETKKNNSKVKKKIEPISGVPKVEKSIFEWFSLETLFHLYNEDKIKNLLTDKASKMKEVLNSKFKMASSNGKIDKMVQLFGLLDINSFSNSRVNMNLKPLPDYSALKEEGKKLNIKVNAFYQGQLEIREHENEETKKEEPACDDEEPNYLPLVDSHAQIPLRRKIVLDKLNRILPDLMRIFTSDNILQMSEVRNLVSTFTLAADNITFRPNEWYLVGIIIIKLLSLKDKHLESIFMLESSQNQLFMLLTTYGLQKDYLENVIQRLTDSTNIMEKLKSMSK